MPVALGGALSVGVLAWAAPAQAQTAPTPMKLAVVDLRRAVFETEEGLRVRASLTKLFDSRQQEIDTKQAQLQKDREQLEKDAQNPKVDKVALQKRLEAWQKQAAEVQNLTYEYQREMSRKESELTNPIITKIYNILKRIAATDGYDMILEKQVAPYFRSDLELTDRAIQMYNQGSEPAGKAPAKPATTAPAPKPATPTPAPTPKK